LLDTIVWRFERFETVNHFLQSITKRLFFISCSRSLIYCREQLPVKTGSEQSFKKDASHQKERRLIVGLP